MAQAPTTPSLTSFNSNPADDLKDGADGARFVSDKEEDFILMLEKAKVMDRNRSTRTCFV